MEVKNEEEKTKAYHMGERLSKSENETARKPTTLEHENCPIACHFKQPNQTMHLGKDNNLKTLDYSLVKL